MDRSLRKTERLLKVRSETQETAQHGNRQTDCQRQCRKQYPRQPAGHVDPRLHQPERQHDHGNIAK